MYSNHVLYVYNMKVYALFRDTYIIKVYAFFMDIMMDITQSPTVDTQDAYRMGV